MKFSNPIVKVAVALALTMTISACGGAEQRKTKYLEKGKAYIEQQNYDKAKIELKNVLQIDPKYAEAYYFFGLVEERQQNWPGAFGNYTKALELSPDYIDARIKLARIYLMAGKPDKAVEMTDAILAKQPDNMAGKALKAAILSRTGDVKIAMGQADALMAMNPTSPDVIEVLAGLYLGQNNSDKAVEVFSRGITANPKNISFRMNLAHVYLSRHEPEKALQQVEEVIRIEPEKFQPRATLASLYAQMDQPDKAEKILREAIQADPEDIDRRLLLAEFLLKRKGPAETETELQAAIKEKPKAYRLRFGLANLYEQTAMSKAEATYREIIDKDGTGKDGLSARDKLAALLMKQGRLDETSKLVEVVLKENPQDNDALTMQGKLALSKGKALDAITSFRSVLKDQPASIEVLTLLAEAHLMNKTPDLAKESLFKAAELNPQNPKARIPLAQFLAKTGDYDGALKKLAEALTISPDMDVLLAQANIQAAKRDINGVEKTLVSIKKIYPDKSVGYFQLGQFYMAQKKYGEAISEFEQALKRSTDTLQPLSAITSAYLAQGKPERAVERLTGILKETPNHPFAHELLAEVYISRKQYPEAEKELQEAIKASPKWNAPYRNLANLRLARNDRQAAEEAYRQALVAIPDDPQLLFGLAEIQERFRDYDKAIAQYEYIVQKNPGFETAVNNLASLLTDEKGDPASLKRAIELASRFELSPQPNLRDTLAWAYYKSGNADKAIAILGEVVKQAPSVPVFEYHLGMAYYKKGDKASAKIHLTNAVQTAKSDFSGLDEARATLKLIP